jgi:hypothetical protein
MGGFDCYKAKKFHINVDIYCYFYSGAFGVDFSIDVDTIEEGLKKVAKGLLPHGVTSFCPTVISSKEEIYRKVKLNKSFFDSVKEIYITLSLTISVKVLIAIFCQISSFSAFLFD